jgi:hypothetical protein
MPLDPIFSDSALLQGVKNDGCPKTATDVSYTSLRGEPVVTNISDKKICAPTMFETNQFLENTSGCCVLDSSGANCTDVANVDASEENNYYMGLRYKDESNPSEGERKICYTTPIRKKKLNIMDILGKITKDIAILITMVLVAACYEYWIVYGNCATNSIKTVLSDSPYSIDSDTQLRRKPKKPRIQDTCEQYKPQSSSTGLDWYDTFPYNLITALNNPEEKQDPSTRKNFSLAELVKIPARSLLLGFFYCIIFSRICMKGLVEISKYLFSDIFTSDNSKIKRFIAGVVFIMIFMGLYGNIADKFVGGLPYMNASSLFLLFFIMTITIWIPSLLGLIMSLISFVGYRRDSYDKYKKRKTATNTDTKPFSEKTKEEQVADIGERLSKMWDWYFIVRRFFQFKSRLCPGDAEDFFDYTDDDHDQDENFYIKDEHILDWFFPIRRSKITIGWYNETVWHSLVNLFNFKNFYKCKDEDDDELKNIDFGKKIYWYISSFYNNPVQLFNLFFSLDVTCNEVNEACKSGWTASTFLFAILWGFIFPQLRIYTWVGSIAFLLFLCFFIPFMNLLWIGFILMIAMYSLAFSLFGNMIALLYLHLYVIIGFFYVPFSDYSKLFKIIKSHGNILTILFCIIVVVASVNVLHPTSVGVIGGLLALIILYQLIIAIGI